MRKYLKIIDNNRATKWARFANIVIDRISFTVLILSVGFLGGVLDNVFDMYYFTEFFEEWAALGRFADILITSLLFFTYIFLLEYFTKGRSIGKLVTGTKVIMIDGTEPTFTEYFIRNISRFVPFDALSFFGENGWHDTWSDTRVVDIKKYNAEKQSKSEIEELGKKEIA